jgi:cell division protein FtsB
LKETARKKYFELVDIRKFHDDQQRENTKLEMDIEEIKMEIVKIHNNNVATEAEVTDLKSEVRLNIFGKFY